MVTNGELYVISAVSYGNQTSPLRLSEISATIRRGEHTSILGANGAGKSTLLYLLAGLYTASGGTVAYNGILLNQANLRDASFANSFRRQVQLVFQDSDAQLFCPTVRDEVLYGAKQVFSPDEAEARAEDALTLFGVSHVASQVPFALSSGEKRRVTLACAMATDPDVLLLDEPTANLDPATVDSTVEWLDAFRRREGKTLIVATHELWLSKELTPNVLVLTPCHRLAFQGQTGEALVDYAFLKSMNLVGERRGSNVRGFERE